MPDVTLVTKRQESFQAFDLFRSAVCGLGEAVPDRLLGYRSGHIPAEVYWFPKLRIWCSPNKGENLGLERFWIAIGTTDPHSRRNLNIDVEVNPPHEGDDARLGGVFLKDGTGRYFIGHTGKVGGGTKGIGKANFCSFYRGGNWVSFERNSRTDYALVFGPVETARGNGNGYLMVNQLAHFAYEVVRFKDAVKSGNFEKLRDESQMPSIVNESADDIFRPEFKGKKVYKQSAPITATCNHGIIVGALAQQLEQRGFTPFNNQQVDLFLKSHGRISAVFEVKTDLYSTSIYTAVGQAMIHAAKFGTNPKKILVLPGSSTAFHKAFQKLGILVLTYDLAGNRVTFADIDSLSLY